MFIETPAEMAALSAIRAEETAAAVAECKGDKFAEYWAQSASASVLRDYKAGRFVTVDADAASAKRRRKARNAAALRAMRPVAQEVAKGC